MKAYMKFMEDGRKYKTELDAKCQKKNFLFFSFLFFFLFLKKIYFKEI